MLGYRKNTSGEAVMQIVAVQMPVNEVLQIGPPETLLPGEMLIVNLDIFMLTNKMCCGIINGANTIRCQKCHI